MALCARGKAAILASTAFTSFFAFSAPALAEQPAARDESVSGAPAADIIVTASRREESLQDVPMSVSVATGEQIQRLNIFDAKDVQQLAPGLQLSNTNGRLNTATLRGVAFDPDQGTRPSVDLYFNEIPIDAQTAFTAIYDVEQIEVLRGPQGALRGRTAPAGAITIRTRKPDLHSVNGYMQGTATDDHGYNVQGAVSLPIVQDKLALRVAMLVDGNRLNQVRDVNLGGRYSSSRTMSGRLSLAWQPSDDFDANLTYQYLKADNIQFQQVFGPGNQPALVPLGDPTRSGPPADVSDYIAVQEDVPRFVNTTHFVTLAANWNLGGATLSFNGGRQFTRLQQSGFPDPGNAIPGYLGTRPFGRGEVTYPVTTAELRLVSNNNDAFWNWSIGAYYSKQTGHAIALGTADTFFATFPGRLGLYLPINTDVLVPIYARDMSVSASSRFKFTDKLTLEVAARLSDLKGRQIGLLSLSSPGFPGVPGFPIPAIPGFSLPPRDLIPGPLQNHHNNPLTGGATLTYKASQDLTLYAAYGRSFRGGSSGVSVPQNISADLIATGPEKTNSFEVGAKATFFDRRLAFDVSAFYQKFNGFLSRITGIYYDVGTKLPNGTFTGPPDGIIDGTFDFNYNGDAKVKGVEATLSGRPVDNWDFAISASYAHARYSGANLPCNDFNGDGIPDGTGTPRITGSGNTSYCASNGRLGEVPDFNLNANTEVRFDMGSYQPFVRALFNYRPGFTSERANYSYRDRELLNIFIGVRRPESGWDISLFAKNVLNQQRITNISQSVFQKATAVPGLFYNSGYRLINATNPREFGVTGTFNF